MAEMALCFLYSLVLLLYSFRAHYSFIISAGAI